MAVTSVCWQSSFVFIRTNNFIYLSHKQKHCHTFRLNTSDLNQFFQSSHCVWLLSRCAPSFTNEKEIISSELKGLISYFHTLSVRLSTRLNLIWSYYTLIIKYITDTNWGKGAVRHGTNDSVCGRRRLHELAWGCCKKSWDGWFKCNGINLVAEIVFL